MFAGFGLFFVAWSFAQYQMGSAVRMGPGYFPAVLGGLLLVLGAVILLQSLVFDGPKVEAFHFKPLVYVSVSVLAYGYLMQPGGLAVATAAAVIIGAMAGNEFKWKEVLVLALVLVLFSYLVFVKGLTLPFPMCPSFIENCPIR
jgi:putative tricarboxylic transport membrane protein